MSSLRRQQLRLTSANTAALLDDQAELSVVLLLALFALCTASTGDWPKVRNLNSLEAFDAPSGSSNARNAVDSLDNRLISFR